MCRRIRVFLAHASEDIDLARQIQQELVHRNIDVFLDDKSLIGTDRYNQRIAEAIEQADVFALLMTEHVAKDPQKYVWTEIGLAAKRTGLAKAAMYTSRTDLELHGNLPESIRFAHYLVAEQGKMYLELAAGLAEACAKIHNDSRRFVRMGMVLAGVALGIGVLPLAFVTLMLVLGVNPGAIFTGTGAAGGVPLSLTLVVAGARRATARWIPTLVALCFAALLVPSMAYATSLDEVVGRRKAVATCAESGMSWISPGILWNLEHPCKPEWDRYCDALQDLEVACACDPSRTYCAELSSLGTPAEVRVGDQSLPAVKGLISLDACPPITPERPTCACDSIPKPDVRAILCVDEHYQWLDPATCEGGTRARVDNLGAQRLILPEPNDLTHQVLQTSHLRLGWEVEPDGEPLCAVCSPNVDLSLQGAVDADRESVTLRVPEPSTWKDIPKQPSGGLQLEVQCVHHGPPPCQVVPSEHFRGSEWVKPVTEFTSLKARSSAFVAGTAGCLRVCTPQPQKREFAVTEVDVGADRAAIHAKAKQSSHNGAKKVDVPACAELKFFFDTEEPRVQIPSVSWSPGTPCEALAELCDP